MTPNRLLPAAILLAVSTLAQAQTIVPVGDRTETNGFFAGAQTDSGGQIRFFTDQNNDNAFDTQDQQAGFRQLNVVGFGSVFDTCADFFTGENGTTTYSVTPGFGGIGAIQQNQIRSLFSNAVPAFNALFDSYVAANGGSSAFNPALAAEYSALQGYAGGMQVALWEILHDTGGLLVIDDSSPDAGNFKVDYDLNPTGSRANIAVIDGQTFLTNIKNGTWVDIGGLNYYYADGGVDQDRLWFSVVPEPSGALLGLLGAGFLLRRRRN